MRNFITENEICKSTYKSKHSSAWFLLHLVITNDAPIAEPVVVFCAFMPSEYPYWAFIV